MNELMAQYWSLRKEAGECQVARQSIGFSSQFPSLPVLTCPEDYMKTLSVQLGLETYGFYL